MKLKRFLYSLSIFSLLIMLFTLCKKDKDETEKPLSIGMSYQGGIIFYIDSSLKHGLIAANSDQSTTAPWWNGSFIATLAISNSDGASNTSAIIQKQGNSGEYAAKLCRDYKGGGFNDWFLPSKDQLNDLYAKKITVGGFSNQIYWSSSEYDLGTVWVQDFETGQQHLDNVSDGANVHTRAIRSF